MLQRTLPLGFVALVIASMMLPPPAAHAADLDYNYGEPPPETKVEFGSGWYVRGDIGATAIPKVIASPSALNSSSGVLQDGPPSILISNTHDIGYTGSIGAGYAFLKWFRTDAVFDFHQPISSSFQGSPFACQNGFGLHQATNATTYQIVDGVAIPTTVMTPATSYPTYGSCIGHYKASLTSYDVLVNGYFDLGHYYGVTPYVGAGVGLSFGHYQAANSYTQADNSSYNINITDPVGGSSYHIFLDRNASGEYFNFAFALMAGFSYDIFDHTKLDIGYRYLHLGQVLGQELTTQEVRAGLRYMIDN